MKNIKKNALFFLLFLAATTNSSFAMDDESSTMLCDLALEQEMQAIFPDKPSETAVVEEAVVEDSLENMKRFFEPSSGLTAMRFEDLKFSEDQDFLDKWNFICTTLPANTNLKKFCLNKCNLGELAPQCWETLENALKQCKKLRTLDLSNNKTKGDQEDYLVGFITHLQKTQLKHIDLSNQTLKDYQCHDNNHVDCKFNEILRMLSYYSSLEHLDLSDNQLDLNHLSLIFAAIPYFHNLQTLNLSGNALESHPKIQELKKSVPSSLTIYF